MVELTAIVTLSKKNTLFSNKAFSKIDKHAEEKSELQKRMIAKNLDELTDFIYGSTTKDMKLALNEILWNLGTKSGTYQACIYWYYWLEKMVKKNKPVFNTIEFSKSARDDNKSPHFDHWIYILWKIIVVRSNMSKINDDSKTWIKKLEKDYKESFKPNAFSKNRFHIFTAFYLLKNPVNWNCNIYPQEHLIIQSIGNVNQIYGFISTSLEQGLNQDQKTFIRKKYYQTVFTTMDKIEKGVPLKKVVNTQINTKNIEDWNRDDNLKEQFMRHQKALERKKDINVVQFTQYPDLKIISPPNDFNINMFNNMESEEYIDFESDEDEIYGRNKSRKKHSSSHGLISKNKNADDIYEAKQERFHKKLDAFTQFVTKKNTSKKSDSDRLEKSKSVLEMMNDNSSEKVILYSNSDQTLSKSDHSEHQQTPEFKCIQFSTPNTSQKKSSKKKKSRRDEDYDYENDDDYD